MVILVPDWLIHALKITKGNPPGSQWLGLYAFTAEGEGPSSVPGWETKIPQASWYDQKKEKKTKNKKQNLELSR